MKKRTGKIDTTGPIKEESFLDVTFHADGGSPRSDNFPVLARCGEVRFDYIEQDEIECDITFLREDSEEALTPIDKGAPADGIHRASG